MDAAKISTCTDDEKTALKRGNQCISGATCHYIFWICDCCSAM